MFSKFTGDLNIISEMLQKKTLAPLYYKIIFNVNWSSARQFVWHGVCKCQLSAITARLWGNTSISKLCLTRTCLNIMTEDVHIIFGWIYSILLLHYTWVVCIEQMEYSHSRTISVELTRFVMCKFRHHHILLCPAFLKWYWTSSWWLGQLL